MVAGVGIPIVTTPLAVVWDGEHTETSSIQLFKTSSVLRLCLKTFLINKNAHKLNKHKGQPFFYFPSHPTAPTWLDIQIK